MKRKKKANKLRWTWAVAILVIFLIVYIQQTSHSYPEEYNELVLLWSHHNEVDPNLVFAVIKNESKFVASAVSPQGAKGLMQIMPNTGQWIARQLKMESFETKQLHDPNLNIQFGCWYLASLSNEYKGNLPMVIAAYNAGRGTVNEWMEAGIWNGELGTAENIPYKETREYVKAVWKSYQSYKSTNELKKDHSLITTLMAPITPLTTLLQTGGE